MRLSKDAEITVTVQVHYTNDDLSPGLKRGGILNVVRHEIELTCPADAIPESIEISLEGLDIGDSLHFSNITLPENVKSTISDRDFTLVTIVGAKEEEPEEVEGEEVEGEEDEAAEGEAEGEEKAEDSDDK